MALSWSLTEQLVASDRAALEAATRAPFLTASARGKLPKSVLGTWVANDRLYIHSYIKSAAALLSLVELPQLLPSSETTEMQLVDWVCDALSAIRKEERWFIDAIKRYSLEVDLETSKDNKARVADAAKLPGLLKFEDLFASVKPRSHESHPKAVLPWLEGAVILWGTERVYLEAWTWAKSQIPSDVDPRTYGNDADDGASRKEFIPNWSNTEFADFVKRLANIIDRGVREILEKNEDSSISESKILEQALVPFQALLAAEAAFWPPLE